MREYCGRVPLILKLNGKTNIADDAEAVAQAPERECVTEITPAGRNRNGREQNTQRRGASSSSSMYAAYGSS